MMILLRKPSLIEVENTELFRDGESLIPATRTLREMRYVLFDKEWAKRNVRREPERVIYFMYRDVLHFGELRYDITIIPHFKLGKEYAKTFGHYHPIAKNNLTYTEIYEMLSGDAHCIIQRGKGKFIEEAYLLKAKKGEKILIPPNFGHVTINKSKGKPLIMGNLVFPGFQSNYRQYKMREGAAYFELIGGELERNRNYLTESPIRVLLAEEFNSRFGIYPPLKKKSIPELAEENASLFDFLKDPTLFR